MHFEIVQFLINSMKKKILSEKYIVIFSHEILYVKREVFLQHNDILTLNGFRTRLCLRYEIGMTLFVPLSVAKT